MVFIKIKYSDNIKYLLKTCCTIFGANNFIKIYKINLELLKKQSNLFKKLTLFFLNFIKLNYKKNYCIRFIHKF
jgi:phosphatidylserine decarboxylase